MSSCEMYVSGIVQGAVTAPAGTMLLETTHHVCDSRCALAGTSQRTALVGLHTNLPHIAVSADHFPCRFREPICKEAWIAVVWQRG